MFFDFRLREEIKKKVNTLAKTSIRSKESILKSEHAVSEIMTESSMIKSNLTNSLEQIQTLDASVQSIAHTTAAQSDHSAKISASVDRASVVMKEVNDEIDLVKTSSEESLEAIGTISLESQHLSDRTTRVHTDIQKFII